MADRDMPERRKWHFDKSYTLILATASMLGAMALQFASFSSRLAVVESAQTEISIQLGRLLESQQRVDARQDADIKAVNMEIRDTYLRIDDKLDQIRAQK